MGSYNSQYESYYNSISSRVNGGRGPNSKQRKRKYFNKERVIRTIKIQLLGTLVLFSSVVICKIYATPQTKFIYSFAKNTLNENYDIKSIVKFSSNINVSNIQKYVETENLNDIENKVENLIDSERAKITGGKTIKQQINQEFAAPVSKKISLFSNNNIYKKKEINNGVEFYIPINTDINTVYDGVVEETGDSKEDGKYIVIDHGSGIETRYSHLNLIDVKKGSKVNKNQVIGKSGNTGEDKSSNLYFQLMYMGEKLNPMEYIKI
jgi:murein DD-endopeptidase MepM/ murein hydrolase activator NlpD